MTLFTRIFKGEIKGTIVYEDPDCVALLDIQPQAPKHILIVPRAELAALSLANSSDQSLLGHLLLVAAQVAREQGLEQNGYRLVINNGRDAGQTVDHLHIHLLGGRVLKWPPG